MRRLFLLAAVGLGLSSPPVLAQDLKVDRHELKNGLTVYTHENHAAPLVSFYIFFKTGSVNEELGITGISHLFEHMMFNGSAHVKPKEFDFSLEAAGGYSNGYTDRDMTAYLETFPPAALDRVLFMEADRLASLSITPENLEQERGIVKEERRLRTDNSNEGKLDELLFLQAYLAHPYRNPVVGFMSDLNHITLKDTQDYFARWYTPNNAIVVMVGDFKTAEVMPRVRAAFESIPKGPEVSTRYGFEPPQEGERRATLVRESEMPMLAIGYHVPGTDNEKDQASLDVLSALLSHGESSRLYRSMVYEKEVAAEVGVYNSSLIGPSLLQIWVSVAPGKDPAEAEKALYQELDALKTRPPTEKELAKARNQLRADAFRSLKTNEGRANELGQHALRYGDPQALKRLIDTREKVTAADVLRVAEAYLTPQNRTVITLIPKVGQESGGEEQK